VRPLSRKSLHAAAVYEISPESSIVRTISILPRLTQPAKQRKKIVSVPPSHSIAVPSQASGSALIVSFPIPEAVSVGDIGDEETGSGSPARCERNLAMRDSAFALSSRVMPAALFATAKLFPNISKTRSGAIQRLQRTWCRRTHGICEREADDAQCCVPLILTSLIPTC
jgi:hypothetical protein